MVNDHDTIQRSACFYEYQEWVITGYQKSDVKWNPHGSACYVN